ncbi:TonB-dependent receptor [Neolewinella aurantiaca]|uniref:TonB-dependent receptor n=1 Tax=Neolewinella aurantiaca TaxID=2602767 RepID=A0A5C7FFN0_9BACT|nr:TonB-dependent receptor [Neolewinella aurantiaca]TXF84730.1 TonB-dependent receptor [Neolewinella aurantiaca]
MRQSFQLKTALLPLLFLTFLCTSVRAQEAVVSGKITDTEGEPLIGATVRIIGSVIGASTDVEGHYEIEVPPGRIRMLYSYIGYENFDTTLQVGVAEREFGVDIVMSESFLETGEVIVTANRAYGQAQALRIQQSSQINQTIIHSETFNKYPDVTIAETVSRMPGVSIIRGVDEGQIVQVRGLPEQYTAVSLNGQRLPTIQPEVDQSGSLDLIQSNLVDEVRVIKARSADMDADAIGGAVDFRVRHPEEKFEVLVQGGAGQNFGFNDNPNNSAGITQLAGTLNSELADEKVYALASASYFKQGRGNRTNFYEYGSPEVPGENLYSARPYDTDRETSRFGFVGAVELRPSIYNRMRLSYNSSRVVEDIQTRQLFANNDETPSVSRISSGWQNERKLDLVALEVENNFPKTRLDYQLSFSQSSEGLNDRLRAVYQSDDVAPGALTEDMLSSLNPYSTVAAGNLQRVADFQDNTLLEEDVAIASMNITRYLNSKRTSYLKAGGRFRSKDRLYGSSNLERLPDGTRDEIPGGTFAPIPTSRFQSDIDSLQTTEKIYDAKQRIAAGYLMYAANFNAQLSLTTGLRYEYIEVEANNSTDTAHFDQSNVLPSVNLTYRIRRDRQLRFSYYHALARPSYATYRPQGNPIPLISIDELAQSNPDLESTSSRNIDLSFERYGRRDGLFTVGIYAKFLENPTILIQESIVQESDFRPTYINNVINVDDANLVGFELGFYQSLDFLSPDLRYVNVNGTYNYNLFDVDNPRGLTDDLPLAQAPRQSANLSFVYSNPNTRLNLVAAANFRDRVFDRLLDDRPIYRNRLLTIDLSADYEVIKNFSIYLRANNLTNHNFEEWVGESDEPGSLLRSESRYGVWGVVGVRFQPR